MPNGPWCVYPTGPDDVRYNVPGTAVIGHAVPGPSAAFARRRPGLACGLVRATGPDQGGENVTEASSTGNAATPILARQVRYLTGVARRAPSLHNTQPWRFTVSGDAIELRADVSRQLSVDPDGREMLISCGAALYGLRLAVRSLGYLPEVEILPGPAGRGPLARVRLGPAAPMTAGERKRS